MIKGVKKVAKKVLKKSVANSDKKKYLTIDPSGTGITGIFYYNQETKKAIFREFQSKDWKEHCQFLINFLKDNPVDIIVYETTNYINLMGRDMTSLFKLFGAIESLKYSFPQVQEVKSIFVSTVKQLYRQVYQKEKIIAGLNYKVGRGGGWAYQGDKLTTHTLDAFLIYQKEINSKNS